MTTAAATISPRQLLRRPLREQRRSLARLAGWSALDAFPVLCSGWLVAQAVDRGFSAGRPALGLLWLAGYGTVALLGVFAGRQATPVTADVVEAIRDHLVRHSVHGGLAKALAADAQPDTAAVARLTRQTEQGRLLSSTLLMTVRYALFTGGAAIVGLAALAPAALAVVLPCLVLCGLMFRRLIRTMGPRQRDLLIAEETVSSSLGPVVNHLRDVVACDATMRAGNDVEQRLRAQASAARRLARTTASASFVVAAGAHLPLLIALAVAPVFVAHDHLTRGQVLGIAVYLLTGLEPAVRMVVQGLGQMGLQLREVLVRLSAYGVSEATGDEPTAPAPSSHRLTLENVSFTFGHASAPVLDGVSLRIAEGERVAVVGPSGTGKSTLANLIGGVICNQRGHLRVGGVDVASLDRGSLRRMITLVPQEAYVFAGSLRDNLTYLSPGVPDHEVYWAAAEIGATELIERLGGCAADVPDPAALSAGERQLITLVRAYLSPARILVLDEATCHLDPVRERQVEEALATQGKTLVIIAHRLTSALRADRIVVLENGRAVAGSHDFLVRHSPLYAEAVGLWRS
jgi:ATP-binding cassette subfamily C protein